MDYYQETEIICFIIGTSDWLVSMRETDLQSAL